MSVTFHPQEPLLLAHYGEILYQLALDEGADKNKLLEGSGIRIDVLQNPEAYLSVNQFLSLAKNALQATGDTGLGLKLGSRLKITTHGALAQAALSCSNLSEAIELLAKYYKIRFSLIDMKFYVDGDEAVIRLDENLGLGPFSYVLIEAMFVMIMEVGEFLFGDKLSRTGRCLVNYPEPPHSEHYRKYYAEAITFDAGVNELRFDKQFLIEPMALANPVAKRLAEQQCEAELKQAVTQETIVAKVKKLLNAKGQSIPSMEEVAEKMHMTSRTLRRQLQSFDTSFQEILAEVRKQKAIHLLKTTDKHIDEIAYELGYSDPSNFGRAFRKWTGRSPSDIRLET
ncbi:MAG: AraC family transcriptional regulator [Pseudomonadales bacterium]|nr:AraC family transcriptional regulator [Pseudomonadales bacterium]